MIDTLFMPEGKFTCHSSSTQTNDTAQRMAHKMKHNGVLFGACANCSKAYKMHATIRQTDVFHCARCSGKYDPVRTSAASQSTHARAETKSSKPPAGMTSCAARRTPKD